VLGSGIREPVPEKTQVLSLHGRTTQSILLSAREPHRLERRLKTRIAGNAGRTEAFQLTDRSLNRPTTRAEMPDLYGRRGYWVRRPGARDRQQKLHLDYTFEDDPADYTSAIFPDCLAPPHAEHSAQIRASSFISHKQRLLLQCNGSLWHFATLAPCRLCGRYLVGAKRTHHGGVAKTAERYVRADDRKRSGPSSRYAASVVNFSGGT